MKKVLWGCVIANIVYSFAEFKDIITPAYIIILLLLIILCSGDNTKSVKLIGVVVSIIGIVLSIFELGTIMIIISSIAIILEVIHEIFLKLNDKKYDKSLGINGKEKIKIVTEYDVDRIREIFDDYIADYDKLNNMINMKYEHTINVAKNAQNIASSIGLDEEGRYLAYVIGILHDVGIFEQIKNHNTLEDTNVIDHADYGCDLLKTSLLRQFIHENRYDEIILKVVKNHNKFSIDNSFSDDEKLYCSILRDADKLDIFRRLSENEFKDDYNVTKDMSISSEITREICKKHSIEFRLINNNLDQVILRLAMVYDINYKYTLKAIKEGDYLNKYIVLIDALDSTKITLKKIVNDIYEDIDNKLK